VNDITLLAKKMKRIIPILFLLPYVLFGRVWTNTEGKQFEGTYIEQDSVTAKIRGSQNYKLYEVPIAALSKEDKLYLKTQTLISDLDEAKKEAKSKEMILCFYHNDADPDVFEDFLLHYIGHSDFADIPKDIVVLVLRNKNLSGFKPADPFMRDMPKTPAIVFMTPNGRDFSSSWGSSRKDYSGTSSLEPHIKRAREVLTKMRNR
jgi:hypothetical protein